MLQNMGQSFIIFERLKFWFYGEISYFLEKIFFSMKLDFFASFSRIWIASLQYIFYKASQHILKATKAGSKFFLAAPFFELFFTAGSWNGAGRKCFDPSYFVTALRKLYIFVIF